MTEDAAAAKRRVRAEVLARRDAIPEDERARRSLQLCDDLMDTVCRDLASGAQIAAFYPLGSEVDLRPFMRDALREGYRLALPAMVRVRAGGPEASHAGAKSAMVFLQVDWETVDAGDAAFLSKPAKALEPGCSDLSRFAVVQPHAMDMVVSPMVAFDAALNRLGYGGGNYDGFFGQLSPDCRIVGVAFREQQVEHVPCEPHDLPLPQVQTC